MYLPARWWVAGRTVGKVQNGNPTVLDTTSDAGYFFPGVVLTGSGGNMTYTFEAAGRLGKIKGFARRDLCRQRRQPEWPH